ncbi:MAG: ATP-binding protein [Nitrospira sp. LK70]|nr:ATP-binding protein [Nitrospira sp. LK70]
MEYISRMVEKRLANMLARGRSALLLGPRQTGKTTLAQQLNPDVQLNFIRPEIRQRYERRPELLAAEIESRPIPAKRKLPLILLDEVQRVPELVNVVQDMIDRRTAQFVLTGSSARKLRRGRDTNWLPGRLVPLRLDPLTLAERMPRTLEEGLLTGALPGIVSVADDAACEQDLRAYSTLYLEEEIRAEALVRNLGRFSHFLHLAALESGGISHFRGLAQELGVAHTTVAGYYEILEDCLIAERVEPLTQSRTRKKLTKSPRYLFFDLGVRRATAEEGRRLPPRVLGGLFEQFVGLEFIRLGRQAQPEVQVRFWRDPDGPEVDWVLTREDRCLPVEVKWNDAPTAKDTRHLETFLREHRNVHRALVICRAPRRFQLARSILALPWQDIPSVIEEFLG